MPHPDESLPAAPSLYSAPGAPRAHLHIPREAWTESLTVRSYEAGRDDAVRPGVILRYLESLATHASAGLGFDNRWYRDHQGAWVVREMALLLGARAAIAEDLRLATWVSDFRRVQASRDYLIARSDSGRLVARAQARWAYIDRESGRLARIPDDLVARMGPWGHGMRSRRQWASREGLASAASMPLIAREYEADTQGHINNCVYLDWFDEAARQAIPSLARPRFFQLEYNRPARPGDTLAVHTTLAATRSRGRALWQWITSADGGANIASAWSEWLIAAAPASSGAGLGA